VNTTVISHEFREGYSLRGWSLMANYAASQSQRTPPGFGRARAALSSLASLLLMWSMAAPNSMERCVARPKRWGIEKLGHTRSPKNRALHCVRLDLKSRAKQKTRITIGHLGIVHQDFVQAQSAAGDASSDRDRLGRVSFTYTLADLASVIAAVKNRALVRIRCGDVRQGDHLLEDEEIDAMLSLVTNDIPQATLRSARLMLGKVSRNVDTDGGGVHSSRSQQFNQVKDLIAELEVEVMGGLEMTLTGNSISEAETYHEDEDKKQPNFEIGMDDNPPAGRATIPIGTQG
jgi:hypothetical protein